MTRTEPSSLIRSLLRFVGSENEALAGDLVEEWCAGRSRRWLWWQVTRAAFAIALRRRILTAGARGVMSSISPGSTDARFSLVDPATMTLHGGKVRGVGGGGLLGAVLLITIVMPQAWFILLAGMLGGSSIAIARIAHRRSRGLSGPPDTAPLSLFDAPVRVSRLAVA